MLRFVIIADVILRGENPNFFEVEFNTNSLIVKPSEEFKSVEESVANGKLLISVLIDMSCEVEFTMVKKTFFLFSPN